MHKKNGDQAGTKPQGVYPIKVANINIAQLLDVVNSTHQSILSNDVLEKLGETKNPSGEYTGKAKFSRNLPGETEALQEEYDRLREKLGYWKGQVKRTEVFTLREEDTRRLTKSILSGYSSRAYHGMQIKDPPMERKLRSLGG